MIYGLHIQLQCVSSYLWLQIAEEVNVVQCQHLEQVVVRQTHFGVVLKRIRRDSTSHIHHSTATHTYTHARTHTYNPSASAHQEALKWC